MSSGWMFTDAVQRVGCPNCTAKAGEVCRLPAGRKSRYPHRERLDALRALPDFDLNDYRGLAVPANSLIARGQAILAGKA